MPWPILLKTLTLFAFLGLGAGPAWAQQKLQIVASFTILADMAREVGGERVEVKTLVGADGDAHAYQPTPNDARAVAGAAILLVNGLGFEGWIDRLKRSANFKGVEIIASSGIEPLTLDESGHPQAGGHSHGGPAISGRAKAKPKVTPDPHAWQDLANAQKYVANIAADLARADPANAEFYRARAQAYAKRLAALDGEIRGLIAAIPAEKRRVITSHDAFQYFARAYGVQFLAASGVSTDAEPSARAIAQLLTQMRKENIKALFIENMTNPKLIGQIARDGGGHVGGTLYPDSLSAPGGPADTFEKMMRHNALMLKAGMLAN